jgi:hypothetical protein
LGSPADDADFADAVKGFGEEGEEIAAAADDGFGGVGEGDLFGLEDVGGEGPEENVRVQFSFWNILKFRIQLEIKPHRMAVLDTTARGLVAAGVKAVADGMRARRARENLMVEQGHGRGKCCVEGGSRWLGQWRDDR